MPEIIIDPKPPTQGQSCTISFRGGTNPQTLSIEWVPPGAGPGTVTTNDAGDVAITIPDNAASMKVTGGGAPAAATTITPA